MADFIPSSPASGGELLFYQTEDGRTRLEVRLQQETVWLSLNQMAELFQRDKSVISRHINNVFDEGELRREATVAKSATVQTEGGKQVTREIEFFNLDVIISVGYRGGMRGGFRTSRRCGRRNWNLRSSIARNPPNRRRWKKISRRRSRN